MYLNCDQGVGLEKTVAVADGEIEERLHYVSWLLGGYIILINAYTAVLLLYQMK